MSTSGGNKDGWQEWSKHVLLELERLNDCYEKLDGRVNAIREEIASLKVKSGMWGAVGACIPIFLGILIFIFKDLFKS